MVASLAASPRIRGFESKDIVERNAQMSAHEDTELEEQNATAEALDPPSARSLLLTLVGEFMIHAKDATYTAPLIHVLGGVGIAEKAARQALARAAAAGWIESERNGRRTAWQLSEGGRALISEGSGRLRTLRNKTEAWNGQWIVLHVSLPESKRPDRLRLYRALSWIGFGNPTPGVWVSPHPDRAEAARNAIERLGLTAHTLAFIATQPGFGIGPSDIVRQSWDLTKVSAHYTQLVQHFSAIKPRSDDDVLLAHVSLVNALQRLPSIDPGLPLALSPSESSTHQKSIKLWALREKWKERAHLRWQQLTRELAA